MSKLTISAVDLPQLFAEAESARSYLERQRWPNGVICPACHEAKRIHARKDGFYRCNACLNDFTVRTGTVFERSKVPLHKWLCAIDLLVTAPKGVSSPHLAKQIGVTQKTAWFMLQRLREACGNDQTDRMTKILTALDAITTAVLAYRPADKGQATATLAVPPSIARP